MITVLSESLRQSYKVRMSMVMLDVFQYYKQ